MRALVIAFCVTFGLYPSSRLILEVLVHGIELGDKPSIVIAVSSSVKLDQHASRILNEKTAYVDASILYPQGV